MLSEGGVAGVFTSNLIAGALAQPTCSDCFSVAAKLMTAGGNHCFSVAAKLITAGGFRPKMQNIV